VQTETFVSHHGVAHVAANPAARRAHPRLRASELRGLKTARLKYGPDVDVIDLAIGGVLFETTSPLTPDATIVLEFTNQNGTVVIPGRLLRCRDVSTPFRMRYEVACAFRRPLALTDFVGSTIPARGTAAATWQRVIARFRGGRMMNGYTNDFHPSKPYLNLAATPSIDDARFTQVAHLEALFFLRGSGDAQATSTAGQGRKIEVTLSNGDAIAGTTLNYRRDGNGFYVHLDPRSENAKVFVTPAAVLHVRFL
jgi:Family of unknown function (DUF6982)/PilZ domain